MRTNSRLFQFRHAVVLTVGVLGLFKASISKQDEVQHPLLTVIEKNYLETPKDQEERPTKVTILGTTCNATIQMTADVEHTYQQPFFMLQYTKYVSIDGHGNPDACLELEVPDIDTKFDLTFKSSAKRDEISFEGHIPAKCPDCKPKRASSVAGTLRKVGNNRYRISFTGDISDTFDLVPKQ
jgi:hypothetical protein